MHASLLSCLLTLDPVPDASELVAPDDDLPVPDLRVELLGRGPRVKRHLGTRGAVSVARRGDVRALHLSDVAERSQELVVGAPRRNCNV